MHPDEVAIDDALVARLVRSQFPHLAGRPLRRVRSTGTVNAIYRLGDDLAVRLPRVPAWAGDLDKEVALLPRLAPHLPLEVPEPVALGEATDGFPHSWALMRWIEGEPYAPGLVDEEGAAAQLAGFVHALRAVPADAGAPAGGRPPLKRLDRETRGAIERGRDLIDAPAAQAAWSRALEAPVFTGENVCWVHADLLPPNILVRGRRVAAVIDFGSVGVGDPAADVIAAWAVFGARGRSVYRDELSVDDDDWERARGYALTQAAMIVPYYAQTNPAFAAMAQRTISEVVDDLTRSA